jgi:formate dehydrogenase subunit beta
METQWMIQTHGNPIETVRELVQDVWKLSGLDGMLVTTNGDQNPLAKPRLVKDPGELENFNPFKPLMTINAARMAPELMRQHPQARLGAVLRPCEMRALVEMVKHNGFQIDNFVTICVDCLGTVPADEYEWRAARKGSNLGQESLQFARQGGIADYRYRSACQTCSSPAARSAQININVLGLPVRQSLLVQARDAQEAARFQLEKITDGPASSDLIGQHERVVARMAERHQNTMARISQHLAEFLPKDIEALIDTLQECGDCQTCMNVCPICEVEYPKRDADQRYRAEDITRWLVSCAGCGMCEQACARRLPLNIIFGHIRNLLSEEFNYRPGRSTSEALPV